jgi:hypothetical protein
MLSTAAEPLKRSFKRLRKGTKKELDDGSEEHKLPELVDDSSDDDQDDEDDEGHDQSNGVHATTRALSFCTCCDRFSSPSV